MGGVGGWRFPGCLWQSAFLQGLPFPDPSWLNPGAFGTTLCCTESPGSSSDLEAEPKAGALCNNRRFPLPSSQQLFLCAFLATDCPAISGERRARAWEKMGCFAGQEGIASRQSHPLVPWAPTGAASAPPGSSLLELFCSARAMFLPLSLGMQGSVWVGGWVFLPR